MKKIMVVASGILFFSNTIFTGEPIQQPVVEWSYVYKKIYSDADRASHAQGKKIAVIKKDVLPFTQLILSWNARRPKKGHFDFYLRVRSEKTGAWDKARKVASWGDSIQKSYFSRDDISTFNYVRLEMNEGTFGNAFEMEVVADHASLEDVHALFICASDYKGFVAERPYRAMQGLPSVKVSNVPKKSQQLVDHPRAGALCSPTTMSMVVQALMGSYVDPFEFARGVYDEGLGVFGSWSFNTAYAFEKTEGRFLFYTARLSSFAHLHRLLSYNIPVGVSVRGHIKGARKVYQNGHLLVVVGWDKKTHKVICHDPAFDTLDQVEVQYDLAEFLPAWERSYRLAYVAQENPYRS